MAIDYNFKLTQIRASSKSLSAKFGEIYYILVLETKVENFSAGAWIRDMITSIKHFTKWKKIAIVTNQTAVKKFADAFNYVSPGMLWSVACRTKQENSRSVHGNSPRRRRGGR